MSRILYLDCSSGMSGDMFLSTMVDLGVAPAYLRDRLALLALDGYHLEFETVERRGIPAMSVQVVLADREALKTNPYSGDFRNYRQIREMIADSALCEEEKRLAHRIFQIKASAEAAAHRVPIDEVKFHEAGAVDSIVDIVGAAICLDFLKPAKIISTIPPTGYGQVHCAVGTLDVPVPAVREIIRQTGLPWFRSDITMEVLTPTGAAILAGIADEFLDIPAEARCTDRKGHGTGTRDTGLPPMEALLSE